MNNSNYYILLIAVIFIIMLASCGYDGSYRYSCQDYKNWEKSECNPPECVPSGTCTSDLIKEKP